LLQNQWGEFVIQDLNIIDYEKPLSTVFGAEKHRQTSYEDDDPILPKLRLLDYRYMRFCFHPFKGRFVSIDSWKDPSWVDVKSIRAGIDGEEKDTREAVFGNNLINIKEKTIPQLLMDEVGPFRYNTLFCS
jgi:cation-transporting ATPase 13A2